MTKKNKNNEHDDFIYSREVLLLSVEQAEMNLRQTKMSGSLVDWWNQGHLYQSDRKSKV